ncbi:MAG: helix-turn-helix domain-containing protein [Oscillospiraceae bacterium]|nr:helix-turn-helix domain-containing protein [Oscillospiraceae bacterium]
MTQEQWSAIRNRNKDYDNQFFYAVRTTGIVCRPSCTSRLCNPENSIIFSTLQEALAHGFRPCRKCRPELPDWNGAKAELAGAAQKFIAENYKEKFSLQTIAGTLYVNKCYLVRTFKEMTGITPLAYHHQIRCEQAKKLLIRQELSISFISCEVGYQTASHFTKIFKSVCDCTPSEYRNHYLKTLRMERAKTE